MVRLISSDGTIQP